MNLRWSATKDDGSRYLADIDRPYGHRSVGKITRCLDIRAMKYYYYAETHQHLPGVPHMGRRFESGELDDAKDWLWLIVSMTLNQGD